MEVNQNKPTRKRVSLSHTGTPLARPASYSARTAPPTPSGEIQALSGDPNFMTSLARGLAVVRAFTAQKRKLTIAQISGRTALPRAAVRRCLYTLERLGYVQSEGHAYSLRPKMLTLGHAYLSSTPLAILAQPFLDRVSDATEESCSLAVLEGDDILYLARSLSSRILSPTLNVGSRLPAYCTSIGHILLAHLPGPELEAYFARVEFQQFTERTITTREKLWSVLETVRQTDYAVADQEMEIGLRSIAVPVRDSLGNVVAGINVLVEASRVTIRQMKTLYLPHLHASARDLGATLVS
jgi:IclR family pca regulon transcriptional regulator